MRVNILSKVTTYFKEAKLELTKVSWPTRKQALKYTLIVIGASLATAIFLGGIDYLLTYILERLII